MKNRSQKKLLIASSFLILFQSSAFAQKLVFFSSPTKNINCIYEPAQPPNPPYTKVSAEAYVRCDIMQFTPTLKSVPQQSKEDIEIFGKCTVAKMKAFIIQEKGVQTKSYCPTDVPISEGQFVLDYGKSFTRGGLTCVSQMNGMTCENGLGRGFFLSRSSQRLF